MLTGYFDVSRGKQPIYSMAGYIGRVEKWEAFSPLWIALLESEGIKKPFSPADLDNRVGEYFGWSNRRAISFQQRAYRLINEAREVAFGHSVAMEPFERLLRFDWVKEPHANHKSHYYFCGQSLLRNVSWWIERNKIEEPIEYIFEFGDEGWGDLLRLLDEIAADPALRDRYRMYRYSRKLKKHVIQLQAAGVWAYESYKHWVNAEIPSEKRKLRDSWKALVRLEVDRYFNTFDDENACKSHLKSYLKLGGEATRGGKPLTIDDVD